MSKTPDILQTSSMIRMAISGVSVKAIGEKYNIAGQSVAKRIRRYPSVVADVLEQLYPEKFRGIVLDLEKGKSPKSIAVKFIIMPVIIFAIKDHLDGISER